MRAGMHGAARVRKLHRMMRQAGTPALIVTRRENIRYLTGFTGSAGSLLIADGRRPVLITDFRYQLQASAEAPEARLVIQKKDHASAIQEVVERLGLGTLWFDESSMTLDRVRELRKKGLRLKGTKDPVARIRMLKDRSEVAMISKAIRRAEESFRQMKHAVRPGMSERELALRLEMLMREKGARRAAFDIIVASGKNGAMPHASVSARRLRRGDLVTVDFGAEADGYCCDITRTISVGRPTTRQREIHALVLRSQQAAIDAVRPGEKCAEIDGRARSVIRDAGYGAQFGHATGHGIGLLVHEAPTVSALSRDTVSEGMVFTIEPGVYVPGWGGVRIEDMILVTPGGGRLLTSLSRDL